MERQIFVTQVFTLAFFAADGFDGAGVEVILSTDDTGLEAFGSTFASKPGLPYRL
jgi:hypothetical protein